MAKKRKAVQWHNKHVPTKWGLAILSFLLLVTIMLIPVLKQQQDSLIDAAGLSKSDQTIINKHLSCSVSYNGGTLKGTCKQDINPGSGFFVSGHCPGSSAVQCYINSSVSCSTPVGKGTCHTTSTSAGSGAYVSGYCPGASNVQCLVSNATIESTTSSSCKSQKVGSNPTPDCEVAGTHSSGGKYYTGFCSGPSNIKCWVPGATSAKTTGGSNQGSAPNIPGGNAIPANITYVVCDNGKAIASQGTITPNEAEAFGGNVCKAIVTGVFIANTGQTYDCKNINEIPAQYRQLASKVCPAVPNTTGNPGSSCGSGGICVSAAICKSPSSACHLISGNCNSGLVCNKSTSTTTSGSCGNGGTCISTQICYSNLQNCHPIAGTCATGLVCNAPTK